MGDKNAAFSVSYIRGKKQSAKVVLQRRSAM